MQKRFTTLLVIVIVALAAVVSLAPAAAAHHVSGPCDFHQRTDETIQRYSQRQIRCAVERFGPIPGGVRRAVCIADRESGLIPDATSLTGQYLGLFQHAATYWDTRYDTWTRPAWELPTSALRGRTNAIVTIRMVHAAGGWKLAGWPVFDC